MPSKKEIALVSVIVIALGILTYLSHFLSQPTPIKEIERGNAKQWIIYVNDYYGMADNAIHIIDTGGVCLYFTGTTNRTVLAAVPKTQLPSGMGCQ